MIGILRLLSASKSSLSLHGWYIPERRRNYSLEITQAIQHGDGKGEGRAESDDDARHDCLWHCPCRLRAFFGQMHYSIEPGVHECGCHKACEEADAITPPGFVDPGRPDKLGALFGTGSSNASNHHDEKAHQCEKDCGISAPSSPVHFRTFHIHPTSCIHGARFVINKLVRTRTRENVW